MLGVRRQTVSLVAATLQHTGLIRYSRGIVRVTDRGGLEAGACERYEVTEQLYRRIMTARRERPQTTMPDDPGQLRLYATPYSPLSRRSRRSSSARMPRTTLAA